MAPPPLHDRPSGPDTPGPVALLGLMGSGKTSVGACVAKQTGRVLVDVDDVIRRRTGLTVRQLWERAGEAGYRPLERDIVVHALLEGGPVVLAVPAGAPDDELVVEAFATSRPCTVWLRAAPEVLAERVAGSDHRPLLAEDPLPVLRRQARDRDERYGALADLVVDVDDLTVEAAAERIVAELSGDTATDP